MAVIGAAMWKVAKVVVGAAPEHGLDVHLAGEGSHRLLLGQGSLAILPQPVDPYPVNRRSEMRVVPRWSGGALDHSFDKVRAHPVLQVLLEIVTAYNMLILPCPKYLLVLLQRASALQLEPARLNHLVAAASQVVGMPVRVLHA